MTHLTEDERQGVADGTLDGDRATAAAAHMAVCERCAADVTQLRTLMRRLHDAPSPNDPPAELWAGIRARIDARKVIALPAAAPVPRRAVFPLGRRAGWIAASAAAVAAAGVVALLQARSRPATMPADGPVTAAGTTPAVIPASDSTRAYQQQAQQLLDEIEMTRAMLGPSTAAVADSDLEVIDQAIVELRAALVRDPNNAALRQLLASSYRQKLDLLKRLRNAS